MSQLERLVEFESQSGTWTRDEVAQAFCAGRGLELGPGLTPTKVGPNASLSFVDKRSPAELATYFGSTDVVVGSRLDSFARRSFDFLIAHHVLEHTSNPIEALIEWMSYLNNDGVLFLSVPHRQHCPDQPRLVTPPTHFLSDYLLGVDDSSFESREHIYSFLSGWSEVGVLASRSKQEAADLIAKAAHQRTNDLHWHVFTATTLKFVVETAAKLAGRGVIVRFADDGYPNPEHRLVVVLSPLDAPDEKTHRLLALRGELGALIGNYCMDALEGQPLFSLSESDAGKIFVAEGGRARWVREPATLIERGIAGVPPVYLEFGAARAELIGADVMTPTMSLSLGRKQAVTTRVRITDGEGLEISPGAAPLISREEASITYCDKVAHESWQTRYGDSGHVGVDVVLGDRPLDDAFSVHAFDYVVSSHVIEHIPNFIGFFRAVEKILKPNGDLVMLVPDKRYTFDVLRAPSTVDQIEAANDAGLAHPSFAMAADFYSNIDHSAKAEDLWKNNYSPKPTYNQAAVQETLANLDLSQTDLHCWVFTPQSMRTLLEHMCVNHAPSLQLLDVSDTPTGGNEFLVHLRKT